jgi:hypothetical protein
VQNELLAKYPKADVRVYAVWFNMMAGDARETWPVELLTDRRVVHRWDDPKAVGPDARWEEFPTGLVRWGRTIVAARQTLLKEFEIRFD